MASSQPDNKTYLRDGVYVGFNIPFVDGKKFPHPYVEVVQFGHRTVYEYGPQGDAFGGLGSKFIEKHDKYQDDEQTAGALFKISPPPGCTEAQFIKRALDAGLKLDHFLDSKNIAYGERNGMLSGVTCDTGALAILENLGLRGRQFLAMTDAISVNLGVALFDDIGALTPYVGKDSEVRTVTPYLAGRVMSDQRIFYHDRLSEMSHVIFQQIGRAPGIEYPGTGNASYQALERIQGRWHETFPQIPHPEPGHAPPALSRERGTRNNESVAYAERQTDEHQKRIFSTQAQQSRQYAETATDLKPHEIPAHVAEVNAFYNEALRELGPELVTPSITVTKNGVEDNVEYLRPQPGHVVALNEGHLTQRTHEGLVKYDYSGLLIKAPNPVQFDYDMRYALQTGMPVALAFENNRISYEMGRQVALALDRRRDDRGWEFGHG